MDTNLCGAGSKDDQVGRSSRRRGGMSDRWRTRIEARKEERGVGGLCGREPSGIRDEGEMRNGRVRNVGGTGCLLYALAQVVAIATDLFFAQHQAMSCCARFPTFFAHRFVSTHRFFASESFYRACPSGWIAFAMVAANAFVFTRISRNLIE